jgi:hypothetical protein
MFYPLDAKAQKRWAEIVQLPDEEFAAEVAERAEQYDCRQECRGDTIVWLGRAGNVELMLFRIPDPGNLGAIRAMYDEIAESACPIAYAFVNQRGDAVGAWDVFQASRLSYLCHCNRVSGPGADCEA